jgi:phosphatidylethanolamine-binding protein (PEBP) family uncharacterized protein
VRRAAGTAIPWRLACDGDNDSPPLRWSGAPTGTVEVAVDTGSNSVLF